MFEFDEHYDELENLEPSSIVPDDQNNTMPSLWSYLGHDVWTMDMNQDALTTSSEWVMKTAEVA